MIKIVLAIAIFMVFVICVSLITLQDTQTFKAIDERIANKIRKEEAK